MPASPATLVHYGAAKLGVADFTKAVAQEVGDTRIIVNAIAPMAITRMNVGAFFSGNASQGSDRRQDIARCRVPMGRSSAVSPTVVWLSHRSTTLNGEIFSTSSGMVARVAFVVGEGYFNPVHGPEDQISIGCAPSTDGPATHWARQTQSGARVRATLSRCTRSENFPVRAADYLMVGDESSMPAIGRHFESSGLFAHITVLLETGAPDHSPRFDSLSAVDVHWPLRDTKPGAALMRALGEQLNAKRFVCVWIATEAAAVSRLRAQVENHARTEISSVQAFNYWFATHSRAPSSEQGTMIDELDCLSCCDGWTAGRSAWHKIKWLNRSDTDHSSTAASGCKANEAARYFFPLREGVVTASVPTRQLRSLCFSRSSRRASQFEVKQWKGTIYSGNPSRPQDYLGRLGFVDKGYPEFD